MQSSSAHAPGGRIKGAAFAEFVAWFGRRHPARLEYAAQAVSRSSPLLDARSPGLGIIASSWYPADVVHALLDALVRDLDAAERREIAFQGSEAVMRATLRGVYQMLFRLMATPERYARHAPRLWSAYYDSGEFRVSIERPGLAVATIRRWRSHHPFMCELNWGAASAIYRAMGCHGVETQREQCVADGGTECRFATTWVV